ncbi:MAG: hypothetical protein PHI32_06795 [Dysgonamonadaceae bacterium]|nr:hypothetical protein [Dysgonamonadaceae bacterium]MDD4728071.1 hypothetical protein [Dysgonamonadaceae bacterium]
MKVAVFIKNNELTSLYETDIHVVIFNIVNNKVMGVENFILEKQNKDSILRWLNHKSIDKVYISGIENGTIQKLELNNIQVKTYEMLKDDKLFNSLALTSHQLRKTS